MTPRLEFLGQISLRPVRLLDDELAQASPDLLRGMVKKFAGALRAGTVELAIPRLREGSYFPAWLLVRQRRAESTLISVVATCY